VPPLSCTFPFASQDCKIQGTSAQSLWKAVQRSSSLIKANSTAALQGWSGNRITSATSDCTGCSCATEEHSRGCTGGNLNTDFRRSEEERCHQSFTKRRPDLSRRLQSPRTTCLQRGPPSLISPRWSSSYAWRIGVSRTSLRKGRSRWRSFGTASVSYGEG